MGKCSCGRSPTGLCIGWHALTKEEYEKKKKFTIIHTKKFSCANDHPIVWYMVDDENKAVCEYCYTKFLYEPKEDFHTKMLEEKELLDISMKESFRQRDERIEKEKTRSEEMQDELEPIESQ